MPSFEEEKLDTNKGFVAAFSAASQTINPALWFVDSGASMHMTNRSNWMYDENVEKFDNTVYLPSLSYSVSELHLKEEPNEYSVNYLSNEF